MVLAGLMSACLQTLQVFIILLVFVCMQLRAHTRLVTGFLFSPKCTLTVCHLRAQHRNVSELYFDQWVFSDALAYPQIKSWRVTGFEAAVTLLATAQFQAAWALIWWWDDTRTCYLLFNNRNRNMWPDNLSNFYSQNTSRSPRWPTVSSVSPLAVLSAGKSHSKTSDVVFRAS